ncbi:MAG: element excision factor XisI family protein [Candidatus Xenobia bacterium]
MDRVAEYRDIVKRILTDYARYKPSTGDIEVETIFDAATDRYQVCYVGFDGFKRMHGAILHVDIKGGKLWIQYDGTEGGIAEDFLRAGVPRDHIVLGFMHPDRRRHSEYPVG